MSAPSTNISKRLHISFTPSVPSNGSEELAKSLNAHFSKFGTVKSIDGLGKLDGVGLPRKFGYINIEGPEASITKCVNSLSGSIWKGVKVRVGDARPDFQQKIAQENAQEPSPLRRKRKRGNVLAEDMSLVTPENAASRRGWKVSEMGRITHPVRMRPGHALPPPLASAVSKSKSKSSKDVPVKPKKRRDPDSRARRRTIDMARWGSVHLSGMFLENAGQELPHDQEVEEEVNTDESDSEAVPAPVAKSPPPIVKPTIRPVPPPAPSLSRAASPPPDVVDLIHEKTQTLSLLQSLFGNAGDDQWEGRESVDSDVDEEALLKIGGPMTAGAQDGDDDIEFVPMDVDGAPDLSRPVPEEEDEALNVAPAPPPKKAPAKTTKLKDLFVSREEETGFSLLDHLDLELDEELAHVVPSTAAAEPEPAVPVASITATTFVSPSSHAPVTLDPKQPLFFPLLTSFAFASAEAGGGGGFSTKARQRDVLDVGKDNGWNAHFYRSETDEEIRKKWEAEKVDLTRDWNRRWREAGKVRRRRGGGDGD